MHAYPFDAGHSTFIVECHERGLAGGRARPGRRGGTVAYSARLFADELGAIALLTNRSIWRTFPTVRNERWRHGNVVLLGDAAHTAHFSIGSGTKLAMEDAIALADAFRARRRRPRPRVLAAYEEKRRPRWAGSRPRPRPA